MISETVNKFKKEKINILLEEIINRMNSFSNQNKQLIIWLKYILIIYQSQLIQEKELYIKLQPLQQNIKNRSHFLNKLVNLKMRYSEMSKQLAVNSELE